MKAQSLREHTDEELEQMSEDTLSKVFDLRVKKGAEDSSEQPLLIRSVRRDLARIKTVIRERTKAKDLETQTNPVQGE